MKKKIAIIGFLLMVLCNATACTQLKTAREAEPITEMEAEVNIVMQNAKIQK
ncbi:hypothetical protein [uncultured Robinsoniella sp.]|uniref:hypothetical protein n=1 Tax=uncultured Robinsoniella sp. TaxID=904190 RepID=UPI00374FA9C7